MKGRRRGKISGELQRGDVESAAKVQAPTVKDISKLSSLSLERLSIRSIHARAFSGLLSLVSLDLSRNELTSVRGLEQATSLVNLSLYYNRIAYLDEARILSKLKHLESLDLRLNPITRDEIYRSYVVFHIGSLQELDERVVRPAERRDAASTMQEIEKTGEHWSSDEDEEDLKQQRNGKRAGRKSERSRHDAESILAAYRERLGKGIAAKRVEPSQDEGGRKYSARTPNAIADSLAPITRAGSAGSKDLGIGSSQVIYNITEDVLSAVASVILPQQLSVSSVTITHMPDLISRAARPAVASALKSGIGLIVEQLNEARGREKILQEKLAHALVSVCACVQISLLILLHTCPLANIIIPMVRLPPPPPPPPPPPAQRTFYHCRRDLAIKTKRPSPRAVRVEMHCRRPLTN